MTFTQEDAENVSKELHVHIGKYSHEKDAKGLTSLYHADAVLIWQGKWIAYGHDEIQKKNEDIVNIPFDNFDLKQEPSTGSLDGKFVFTRGTFVDKDDPKKAGWYEQIYKKGDDGKYLIYHDIFYFP